LFKDFFYLRLDRIEAVVVFLLLTVCAVSNPVLLFLSPLFVQDSVFGLGAVHLFFFFILAISSEAFFMSDSAGFARAFLTYVFSEKPF